MSWSRRQFKLRRVANGLGDVLVDLTAADGRHCEATAQGAHAEGHGARRAKHGKHHGAGKHPKKADARSARLTTSPMRIGEQDVGCHMGCPTVTPVRSGSDSCQALWDSVHPFNLS